MANTVLLHILSTSMFLIFTAWITVWFLKPTDVWTRQWKLVENSAQTTVFKYNGVDFMVFTFPIILLSMLGCLYMHWQQRNAKISRRVGRYAATLTNPLIVRTPLGVLSGIDVLAMTIVLSLLVWTFYARVSKDFSKLVPAKPMKLNIWQLKFFRMSTRFGLLAETCLALLLFPVLRGLSVFRLLGIQFEAYVRYHIWLGTMLIFFATLHGTGTLFIWGINHQLQHQMWRWQKEGRIYLAGVMAFVTALIIWITSLPLMRRRMFSVFFYTHHLYLLFIAFFLFHAGDRHFYMVFPGIFLFGLDKVLRLIHSWPKTQIHSVRIFPSKIMELTFLKDPKLKYTPTSIVFIKVPMISQFQWHPFSITSSSTATDETMTVVIKCEGCWTNSLYNMLSKELDLQSQTSHISVAVEGPYGPAFFDYIMRYDSLVLIAGGIGITPMLSILQEFGCPKDGLRNRPTRIQLIYVTKKSRDISLLSSISHLILNQSSEYCHLKLKVFVTQEQKGSSSLQELLNESLIDQRIIQFGDLKRPTYILGSGNLLWMAVYTGITTIKFLGSLCFFNHFVLPAEKKSTKPKTPSTVVDLFLLLSFLIAIACTGFAAAALRWRNSRKDIISTREKEQKVMELSSTDEMDNFVEHEIHYGNRPMFKEILSELESGYEGSDVGVVVCGPESMKESVALVCQQRCQALKLMRKKQQPVLVFHPLNFTL